MIIIQYSAKLHVQSGKCSKTKNARGAREIAFAAIFISQIICRMFPLKEKQQHFASSAYDYRKGSKNRWYTMARCRYSPSKRFFPKMFTNPGLLLTNVAIYDKPTEFIIFRSPGISDAGIQRSVAYTDGQRNRYVLL